MRCGLICLDEYGEVIGVGMAGLDVALKFWKSGWVGSCSVLYENGQLIS